MIVRDVIDEGFMSEEEVDSTSSDALELLLNLCSVKELYS